jgi:hypothetical protein
MSALLPSSIHAICASCSVHGNAFILSCAENQAIHRNVSQEAA